MLLNGATVRASSDELRSTLLTDWGLGSHGERWCQQTIRQPWLPKWHRDHVLRVAAFPLAYLPSPVLRDNPWIEDRREQEAASGHALYVANYRVLAQALTEELQRLLVQCETKQKEGPRDQAEETDQEKANSVPTPKEAHPDHG